ncbi:MAG: hypothetical protein ACXVRX_13870 [Solirubrobacteraceae bacterium]
MPTAHQVGGINLPAAIGLGVMIIVFAASLLVGRYSAPPDADPPDDDGRGGGGGSGPAPRGPEPTPGGIPLDDADPALVRLRDGCASRRSRWRPRSPDRAHPRPRSPARPR